MRRRRPREASAIEKKGAHERATANDSPAHVATGAIDAHAIAPHPIPVVIPLCVQCWDPAVTISTATCAQASCAR